MSKCIREFYRNKRVKIGYLSIMGKNDGIFTVEKDYIRY